MKIFDFFIPFWQESERQPFSTTEAALYNYLLYEANRNYWAMPIRCSTAFVCYRLSTTRQNIQKARETLKLRGLIDYKNGFGKRKPAEYTLLSLTVQLPGQLSDQLTLLNMKNKDIITDTSSMREEETELLPISSLRDILLSDIDWQNSVIALVGKTGYKLDTSELSRQIDLFFNTLSVKGITMKCDHDCRSHFYNWVFKQISNKNKISHERNTNPRRGVGVPNPSEQNYEGAF